MALTGLARTPFLAGVLVRRIARAHGMGSHCGAMVRRSYTRASRMETRGAPRGEHTMSRREVVPAWEHAYHNLTDPHRSGTSLSDLILGGQDGVVNVLGVLLGVAAAGGGSRIIVAAGLATASAGAISMAAVAYTSALAAADVYRSELAREHRHVRQVPTLERAEVRDIYERKGFSGALLDRIVETITADPDVWVALMMSEEHHLAPVSRRDALRSAVVVGLSALVGALVPVAPFLFGGVVGAAMASVGVAGGLLFGVGAYKAKQTKSPVLRSAMELVAIGLVSAIAAWGIGTLFGVATG
jgi:VIT1/CCC1 family predicted Fe2+/Mn2+ transporter